MTVLVSPSRGSSLWQRWRFHLSALLLILPIVFTPAYLRDTGLFDGVDDKTRLGAHEIGEFAVGPWSVRLAESWTGKPGFEGRAGYAKEFTMALCSACIDSVRAAYLRVGKPRNVRTAGALFSGAPYRQTAEIRIPERATADDLLWLTLEGWDGTLHQTTIPIRIASPAMTAWLDKRRR